MTNPICIDLSHWNPTPTWSTLKANGTLGVIHKATEGSSYVDETLFTRARAAMDAGLLWSTYHFLKPGGTFAQMDHYLSTIQPVQGERVVLDHEDAGVALDQLEDAVRNLLELRPDLQVTIYSGHLIKEQLADGSSEYLAANTSLWVAQYTSAAAPSWPSTTWPQWSLWQYTDKAKVSGVSKPVDGNQFNGEAEQFLAWMTPTSAAVPPVEPPPTVPSGEVVLTVPQGQRVIVNGLVVEP